MVTGQELYERYAFHMSGIGQTMHAWDELDDVRHMSWNKLAEDLRGFDNHTVTLKEVTFGDITFPSKYEMEPGRWWRVIAPDGSLWCETSDEQEARERKRKGDKLQRLWQFAKVDREWMDAE